MSNKTAEKTATGVGGAGEHEIMLDAHGLSKRFGDLVAVDDVSFTIRSGEIFGLLGPNGAGKTTTISMVSCLMTPDSGDATVAGHSITRDSLGVRGVLGVVPQEIALYPTLTAAENLRFWGRMYGLRGQALEDAVTYGLAMAGLEDKAKVKVETFSGGMKRRINIAAGILHRPQVLLMDEPTVGIDPQSRNHILDTVRELNKEGMTVVYTSHYMEEVEALCDRVAIIDHGKVIALGTLDELRALVGDEDHIRIALGDETHAAEQPEDGFDAVVAAVREIEGVTSADLVGPNLDVLTPAAAAVLPGVVAAVTASGVPLRSIEVVEPDLESVFLHLTGRGLRD